MGAGVSCCGGKSTDIVDSINPPLEKRSIGVGDSKETAETGTGNDEENSSQDSGRVSPTPSTVSIDSVYTLEEGDRYTKTPEPTREGILRENTSDYDSATSNGAVARPSLRRKKRAHGSTSQASSTSNGNRPRLQTTSGSQIDSFANGLRQYPTQPSRKHNPTNFSTTPTQRNRDYFNPGFVGSIGSSHDPNQTRQGNSAKGNIHTFNSTNNGQDTNQNNQTKSWGNGYRLGGNSSSEANINRNSRDILNSGYSPSVNNHNSARSSRTPLPQTSDAQYRLDGQPSRDGQSSRSGFNGHHPLSSRTSSLGRSVDDSASGNLSVTGHAMNVAGRRRENHSQERRRNSLPQKSEAFYLPMDSLVTPSNKENNKRNKKKKKQKKGDAFLITFDGDGTSTLPLNDEEDQDESSSDGEEQTSNQSSRAHTGFGDYSYNLSRSNSRSTTLSDITTSPTPADSTQRAFNKYKNTRPQGQLNNENTRNSQIKPSAAIAGSSRLTNSNKSSHPYSNKELTGHRPGQVRAWKKDGRMNPGSKGIDPHAEMDALNEHIRDLRQLLAQHMKHKGNKSKPSTSSDDKETRDNSDTELVERLQSEIVALENKLCEKEDKIQQLMEEQREGNHDNQAITENNDVGVQAGQEMHEMGTDVQDEIETLEENYQMMLSDLDKNAVTRLDNAKKAALSEEELENILKEHIQSRDLLRNNMLQEKQTLDKKLKQRLESRKRVDMKGEVESQNKSINKSPVENENMKNRPPVPPRLPEGTSSQYGDNSCWKPGLSAIGEGEESETGKRTRVRTNTFTKDDENDSDQEVLHEKESRHDADGTTDRRRSGTCTRDEESSDQSKESVNVDTGTDPIQHTNNHQSFETQTDISGDLSLPLRLKKNGATTSDASTSVSSTSTSTAETSVDPSLLELQRLTTNMKKTIENIPKQLEENDKEFIKNTQLNRDKMSAEEMHTLLKQHLENQENFEAAKVAELQKQQKTLLQKIANRKRYAREVDEDMCDSDVDDMEELTESLDRELTELLQKKNQHTQISLQQMPSNEDEMHHLLSQHRQQREELRKNLLNGRLKQIENLQKKMLQRKQTSSYGQSTSTDQTIGVQVEQQSQEIGTQAMSLYENGISIETNTDPPKKRHGRESEKDTVDISGVLQEHKDRVQELRQIKHDHGRVHQEKAQERLARRLKKKKKHAHSEANEGDDDVEVVTNTDLL